MRSPLLLVAHALPHACRVHTRVNAGFEIMLLVAIEHKFLKMFAHAQRLSFLSRDTGLQMRISRMFILCWELGPQARASVHEAFVRGLREFGKAHSHVDVIPQDGLCRAISPVSISKPRTLRYLCLERSHVRSPTKSLPPSASSSQDQAWPSFSNPIIH